MLHKRATALPAIASAASSRRWQPPAGRLVSFSDRQRQGYFNLKGYREFAAENRPDGWNAWATFSPSPPVCTENPKVMVMKSAQDGAASTKQSSRSFRQLRRFHHVINSNKVFGTHKRTRLDTIARTVGPTGEARAEFARAVLRKSAKRANGPLVSAQVSAASLPAVGQIETRH